jgi:hypothetical protein
MPPDVLSNDNDPLSQNYEPPPPPPPDTPPQRDPDPTVNALKAGNEKSQQEIQQRQTDAQLREMQGAIDKGSKALDRSIASAKQEQVVAGQRDQALAPFRKSAIDATAAVPAAARNVPQQEKPPPVPKRGNEPGADENWLMVSGLLGSIAGAFTRRHATNALAAFTGMIEGYNEGSRQKFEQNLKTWEAENKRALDANKASMDSYRAILESKELDAAQKRTALQIEAQRWDDKAMFAAAGTKNDLAIAHAYDYMAGLHEKAATAAGRVKQEVDAARTKEWDSQAAKYVAQNPNVIQGMLNGTLPPPQRNPRTGLQGAVDRAEIAELIRLNPQFDWGKFDRIQGAQKAAERIEATTPAMAKRAGEMAEQRTLGTAGANVQVLLSRAPAVLTNAAEAANRVPATIFPRINELYQRGAEEIGDPAVRSFKVANEELANLFAAVNNPRSNVITVSAQQEARKLISAADSPEAYQEVLENIKRIAEREGFSIRQLRSGNQPPPIEIPPISDARRTPVPEVAGQMIGRAVGGVNQALPAGVEYWKDVWERAKRKGWSLEPLDQRSPQ